MKFVKLGEIAEVISGQSPEGIFYNKDGKGIPFYQGKKDFGSRYLKEPIVWTTQITKTAKADDILMSVRAPVGPINLASQEICIGRGLAAIRVGQQISNDYLFYFLESIQPTISGTSGAVFDSINKEQISSIQIPLPNIVKQKQIVEKLNKALSEIDSLEKNLQLKKEKTIQLLQSMLSAAFNQTKDSKVKIMKLGEIAKIGYGYTAKSSLDKGQVKILRITDIQNGNVDWNSVPKCDISSNDYLKFKLNREDIVFARTGATTGKSFKIDSDVDSVFASYLIRLVPDQNIVIPDFIKFYFNTSVYWSAIQSGLSGSAQGGFNASKLSELPVPIPSISEQNNRLKLLEIIDLDTKIKISNIRKQIKGVEDLRKSILSNAFNFEEKVA